MRAGGDPMESIQQAQPADAAAVLELIKARIRWMDEQGIRQWGELVEEATSVVEQFSK